MFNHRLGTLHEIMPQGLDFRIALFSIANKIPQVSQVPKGQVKLTVNYKNRASVKMLANFHR